MIKKISGKLVANLIPKSVGVNTVRTMYPSYHRHLVVPPRVRIPFPEKVFWGIFMFVGIVFTPVWILSHLADYRGEKKEKEE